MDELVLTEYLQGEVAKLIGVIKEYNAVTGSNLRTDDVELLLDIAISDRIAELKRIIKIREEVNKLKDIRTHNMSWI